ncbi:MAG TPA: DUF4271 domain-containing protein [Bacteroidales bacterium]
MPDTLNYYQLIQQNLADSSLNNNYFEGKFIGTFIQNGSGQIEPVLFNPVSNDYIAYTLLFFISGIALIWSFLPERLYSVFNISTSKGFSRSGETNIKTPGLLISLFFFFNFIFSFSIFLFLSIKNFSPSLTSGISEFMLLFYILAILLAFYLFRFFYIKLSGFIFRTSEKSSQQLNIYINTENAFGVLLIPVLLLSLFANFQFALYAGPIMFLIFLIIRWVRTFFIGISIAGFSVLHLILYLCTLEILPVLIVIKLVENGVIR